MGVGEVWHEEVEDRLRELGEQADGVPDGHGAQRQPGGRLETECILPETHVCSKFGHPLLLLFPHNNNNVVPGHFGARLNLI